MIHMKKAQDLFHQAAAQGSGHAAYRLGELHLGEGILNSPKTALDYLEQGATTGYAPALYQAALLIQNDHKKEDYLLRAAKAKLTPAAEKLALLYFSRRNKEGLREQKDKESGMTYLHQAAEGGSTQAQICLSALYRTGTDTLAKDEDKADFWQAKAADGHSGVGENLSPEHNLLLNALQKETTPTEEKISPLSRLFPQQNVPDTLPERSERVDGLTEGELLSAWDSGNLKAVPELARRYEQTPTHLSEMSKQADDHLIRLNTLAREGDTSAALELSGILLAAPSLEDKKMGLDWLNLLSKQKNAPAMLKLADQLTPRHPEDALPLLIRLAERNSLPALSRLQHIFGESGLGAELNPTRSLAYQAQQKAVAPTETILKLVRRDQKQADAHDLRLLLEKLPTSDATAQENKTLKTLLRQLEQAEKKTPGK